MSSLVPSPYGGAIGNDDFKSVTPSRLPHRFATSQNPEDIVASRYLQRLGNTLVRRTSSGPSEKGALDGGRTPSSKARLAGSRPTSSAAVSLASVPAASTAVSPVQSQLPQQQFPYRRGDDGASATRRWRTQVAAPSETVASPVSAPAPSLSSYELSVPAKTGGGATHTASPLPPTSDAKWPDKLPPSQQRPQPPPPPPTRSLSSHDTTDAYSETVQRANMAVSQAAALMSTGAPAPRKVRSDEERNAIILAQEHAKLMLLVGRLANLETDIEDALELREMYEEDSQHAHTSATTPTNTFAPSTPQSAILPLSSSASSPDRRSLRTRCDMTGSKADADAQLSIEVGAVRRRVRQLLENLLGNGVLGTTLDKASLTGLVQQLQSQLDIVESDLTKRWEADDEDEPEDPLGASGATVPEESCRQRGLSTASSGTVAMQAVMQPKVTLLQRRKRAYQRQQADLLEASSNQQRMEWLLKSVDAELITDVPAESAAAARAVSGSPPAGPLLSLTARQPVLQASRPKRLSNSLHQKDPDEGLATRLSLLPQDNQPDSAADSDLSPSPTRAISQPSMVPFSLSDSVSDTDPTRTCSGGRREHTGKVESAAHGLNLLGFMTEVIAQYELDLDEAAATGGGRLHCKKRPLTAPSRNASVSGRPLPFRPSVTKNNNGDSGDLDSANSGSSTPTLEGGDASKVHMHAPSSPSAPASGKWLTPGATRGPAAKSSRLLADNVEGAIVGGTATAAAAAGGGTGKSAKLVGAQLRNLRTGLLQDLHELRTLYDYMHLIDDRRRQLSGGAGGTAEDVYDVELERKLAEHRLQQEVAQRSREEAQRRKAEGEDLDAFGRTTRGADNAGGTNQARRSKERRSSPPPILSPSKTNTPSKMPPLRLTPEAAEAASRVASPLDESNVNEKNADDAEEGAVTAASSVAEVETALTRECVADGKLYFTLVGFSAPPRVPSAGYAGEAEKGKSASITKKRGSAAAGAAPSFLRYELRVERLDSAWLSARKASKDAAAAAAAAAPLVAVVKVNPRRLLNLKLTPAAGVTVVSKHQIVTMKTAVERDAPPRPVFTLVPAKRHKASSFAKAFEFGSAVETAPEVDSGSDEEEGGSGANSVASMPFTFPSRGDTSSRSASLDSCAVLPAATATAATTSTTANVPAQNTVSAANTSSNAVPAAETAAPPTKAEGGLSSDTPTQNAALHAKRGKRGATGGKKTAARAGVAAARAKEPKTSAAQETTPLLVKKKREGDATAFADVAGSSKTTHGAAMKSDSLPPIRSQKTPTPTKPPPPSTPLMSQKAGGARASATQLPLPSTPPMQEAPRPMEDWGVPHPHTEMEAVERNAVVLTVLWAEEVEPPRASAADAVAASTPAKVSRPTSAVTQQRSDCAVSPAEALLAAIPDENGTRVASASAEWPASALLDGDDGVGDLVKGEWQPGASTAAAIDAVASEVIRQVMNEDDAAPLPSSGTDKAGGSVAASPTKRVGELLGEDVETPIDQKSGHGALNSSQQALTEGGLEDAPGTAGDNQNSREAIDKGGESAAVQPASSPPAAEQQQQQQHVPAPPHIAEARKQGVLPSKSVGPPKMLIGVKAPPLLTITSSQSPSMRAEEAQQFSGGPFHLDIAPEEADALRDGGSGRAGAAGADATCASSPAPRPASGATAAASVHRGRSPLSLDVSAGEHYQTLTAADSSAPFVPPIVVTQNVAGSSKVHVLLPQEAVTCSLGPRMTVNTTSVADAVSQSRSAPPRERRVSAPDTTTATTTSATKAPTSAELAVKEQFSVLPKSGAAAEAAADARTIAHVQTFLQAVMRHPKSEGSGGDRAGSSSADATQQSDVSRGKASAAGGGTGVLRSEVDQLQEEARQLFMLDPVRYDAVVTELMEQAAEELQRELAREHSSSPHSTNSAVPGLPPMLAVPHAQQECGASASQQMSKQHMPASLLQASSSGDDAVGGGNGNAHVLSESLSSAIPNPNMRRQNSSGSAASINASGVIDGAGGGSSSSSVFSPAQAAPFTSIASGRLPSFSYLPHSASRRSTHALVVQSDATRLKMNSAAVKHRLSRADAVAEVERILYEQMKAKLLLRAIIEKMQTLWESKQRSVEEKNRGRVAQRLREAVNRALAVSWPIEQHRVINLRKLICLLDRRVGRVHGWLPYYSDTNVLMTAPSNTMASTVLSRSGIGSTTANTRRSFTPLSTWYRAKDAVREWGGNGHCADDTCDEPCPRYLRYLPQRRIYHYMRLAKSRRLMPLQLVRADVQESHSRHILLGYEKVPLEEDNASMAGAVHAGWPKRDLPPHARFAKRRQKTFVPERYADMRTRGERERYLRRLQGAAAFQGVSKMFSPQTQREADLHYSLH